MADAPERIWVDDWNDVCRKPSVCGVEYVRADLYAPERKSRSEVKRLNAQGVERTHYADAETLAYIVALEQERELLPCNCGAYFRDEAEGYAPDNLSRGQKCPGCRDTAQLREAIRPILDWRNGHLRPQRRAHLDELARLTEGENDGRDAGV